MTCSLKIALKKTSKKFNKTKNHIIINRTKSVWSFLSMKLFGFIKAVEVIQPRAGSVFLLRI